MFIELFKDISSELKIINWTTKDKFKKSFVAVIGFTLMYIVLVGVFDFISNKLINMIIK